MVATTVNPFDRQVVVTELRVVHPQLIYIKGTVKNIGAKAWNSERGQQTSFFCLGYQLSSSDNAFPVVEKLLPISVFSVPSQTEVPFEWYIPIPQQSPRLTLLIDVVIVADNRSWFNELGTVAPSLELTLPTHAPQEKYRARFSDIELKKVSETTVLITGYVKNTGDAPWNDAANLAHDVVLGLRVYDSIALEHIVEETRGALAKRDLFPGEESRFSIPFSAARLGAPHCVKVCMLIEGTFWFDEVGASAYLLDLSVTRAERGNVPDKIPPYYRAAITPHSCSFAHGFLIEVAGTLKNIGLRPWNPPEIDRTKAVAVGIKILDCDTHKVLREGRAALPTRPIPSGEELPFAITLSTLALAPGRYLVIIDLLMETLFWFGHQESTEIAFGIEIPRYIAKQSGTVRALAYRKTSRPEETAIILVAPSLPLYDKQAGGKRLLNLLKILRAQGFPVDYFYESSADIDDPTPYLDALLAIGIEPKLEALTHLRTVEPDRYAACIFAWYEVAERYLPIVREHLPETKIIIDTVDIHWVRERRGVESGELSFSPQELEERKLREATVYGEADLLWVVTDADLQTIIDHDHTIQCQTVPLIYEPQPLVERAFGGTDLLFLGGFRHPPNIAAAIWGAEICERFRKVCGTDGSYVIVGDAPPSEIRALESERVAVTGFVDNLDPYFERSRALIAPLKSGAGMKGKICDAIYAGLPVVTTDVGAEGLNLENGRDFFLANSTDEFVEALKKLFDPKFDRRTMCKNGYQKIRRLTSMESIATTVRAGLTYRPVVISIVTYNQRALLEKCLESILRYTRYPDLKIAVVSNACTDGTRELLERYAKSFPGLIEPYFNAENLYFVKPNNFIIDQYPDRDVVMLNNDIEILSDNWLEFLHHGAYASSFIGAAGGMLLDKRGMISEAGAEIDLNGYGTNVGRGAAPDSSALQIPRLVGYCSGCLLYLKREVLKQFGALDERFHPMYYEDVELQVRFRRAGLRTMYVPLCRAIHAEGSSAGTDLVSGMKRYQEINRKKYLEITSAAASPVANG